MFAAALRREICALNHLYARAHALPHALSYGTEPVVVYENGHRAHGNFCAASWRAICSDHAWQRRLKKVHTSSRTALPRSETGPWRELDSCTSSDALLMNIFCHPGVRRSPAVAALLGVDLPLAPEFGVRARVPLANGNQDRTEVDMRLGTLLVEAKLTETGFQSRPKRALAAYRDFAEVFGARELPQNHASFTTYQLLRNVLAAHATGGAFCVLCDARRPDLIEQWYTTLRCVRIVELRTRCQVLTWQELVVTLPRSLQRFLREKYGIAAGDHRDDSTPALPG